MKLAARKQGRPKVMAVSRPELMPVTRGVSLARLLAAHGDGWLIRLGALEQLASIDPAVDPALLGEAYQAGARVLVEVDQGAPTVVGVVQTSRTLRIDRTGRVEAQVEKLTIQARTEVVLKTFAASLQLKADEVEVRGVRVLLRAREVAKVLARMISLN